MKRLTTTSLVLASLMIMSSCSFLGQQENKTDTDYIFTQEQKEESVKPAQTPVRTQGDVSQIPTYQGAGKKISSVNVSGKYVALTFDDGPHPSYTPKILDILKKYNAKATFFVLGSRVKSHPSIVARTVAEGNEVGVHTWNHPNLTKLSNASVRKEMGDTISAIQSASNYTPHTMRPPYGAVNTNLVNFFAQEYKMSTIMWSIDTNDWRKPGVQAVINEAVNKARPGSIILVHDIHGSSYQAVEGIVSGLINRGFKLVTVSQLMAMQTSADTAPTPVEATSPAPSENLGATQVSPNPTDETTAPKTNPVFPPILSTDTGFINPFGVNQQ